MTTCIFTIVAGNYLHHAHSLMRSVRRHAPEARRVVFLCDRIQNPASYPNDDFELIQIEALDIPSFASMAFRYSVVELCTAVKPFCANHILSDHDNALYFDPDIKLFASPVQIVGELDHADILLTPHLLEQVNDNARPNEIDILRVGAYNLGFIGLTKSDNTHRFLSWWQQHLTHRCVVAPNTGVFVDQKWIDLVPGLFSKVLIMRNPGLNVAYWNLRQRELSKQKKHYYVNGEPLVFFHFSGIDPKTKVFSRHQNRFTLNTLSPIVREIVSKHMSELNQIEDDISIKNNRYMFGYFADGEPISPALKVAYQRAYEQAILSPDPALPHIDQVLADKPLSNQISMQEKLVHYLNEAAPHPQKLGTNPLISRAVYQAYLSRTELPHRYPDIFGTDAAAFCKWLVIANRSTFQLPAAIIDHINTQLIKFESTTPSFFRLYHELPFIRNLWLTVTTHNFRTKLSKLFKL